MIRNGPANPDKAEKIASPSVKRRKMYNSRGEILAACTDKKENIIFLKYKEIQSGAVAKSYMRNGFLIYGEMRKYFPLYEEAVSYI